MPIPPTNFEPPLNVTGASHVTLTVRDLATSTLIFSCSNIPNVPAVLKRCAARRWAKPSASASSISAIRTSKTRDEILRKVETASKYVPAENLSLCQNCGFSGSAADAWVSEDIEKRKLAALVEAAHRIW